MPLLVFYPMNSIDAILYCFNTSTLLWFPSWLAHVSGDLRSFRTCLPLRLGTCCCALLLTCSSDDSFLKHGLVTTTTTTSEISRKDGVEPRVFKTFCSTTTRIHRIHSAKRDTGVLLRAGIANVFSKTRSNQRVGFCP